MYYEAQNIFPSANGNGDHYGYTNPIDKQVYTEDKISLPLDPGYSDKGTQGQNPDEVTVTTEREFAPGEPAPGDGDAPATVTKKQVGAVIGWLILVAVAIGSTTKRSQQ